MSTIESEKQNDLEDTTEIEVSDAVIPKFNLVIYGILILICIIYFFTNLKAPW